MGAQGRYEAEAQGAPAAEAQEALGVQAHGIQGSGAAEAQGLRISGAVEAQGLLRTQEAALQLMYIKGSVLLRVALQHLHSGCYAVLHMLLCYV